MVFNNLIISEKSATMILRDIGVIGMHEHCRDTDQKAKGTIEETRIKAREMGFKVICDMPNTDPPITTETALLERLEIAKESDYTGVKYMVWFGLTSDPEQIRKAVELYNKYEEIVGFKIYAAKTTGTEGLLTREKQKIVYETLAELDYDDDIAVHSEEESLTESDKFDPAAPETHADARPEVSETFSINQQIELIKETGFKGHIHICHLSSHNSVKIIEEAKADGMRISCGITPQMLIFSTDQMRRMRWKDAMDLKCNPPVRNEANRTKMIDALYKGEIDIVETDHAPHTDRDKEDDFASGVKSLHLMKILIIVLKMNSFSDERIKEVLRDKPLEIFTRIKNV